MELNRSLPTFAITSVDHDFSNNHPIFQVLHVFADSVHLLDQAVYSIANDGHDESKDEHECLSPLVHLQSLTFHRITRSVATSAVQMITPKMTSAKSHFNM